MAENVITWEIKKVADIQHGMEVMVKNRWRKVISNRKIQSKDARNDRAFEIDGLAPIAVTEESEFMVKLEVPIQTTEMPAIEKRALMAQQTADPQSLINPNLRTVDDGEPDS